ncbi:MAG: ribulose-phosphate 3-epimerase [Oscillospiraceae bacterium]|nr:ribulose-phosphate 3-epimerase [Oscillospiraceae bacterium]
MIKVSPSILSADFANLERDMKRLEVAGADWAHVDVMDGHFVPNISIGAPVVRAISKVSKLPLDVHLMISDPAFYLDDFIKAGAYAITIHEECDSDIGETLRRIKDAGVLAALSIKPKTPVSALEKYIDLLDMVLIMTVEPGFGGQKFIEDCLPKISEARSLIDAKNPACLLEIDGGVTTENVERAKEAGANVIVAGSSVFGAPDMAEAIRLLGK